MKQRIQEDIILLLNDTPVSAKNQRPPSLFSHKMLKFEVKKKRGKKHIMNEVSSNTYMQKVF